MIYLSGRVKRGVGDDQSRESGVGGEVWEKIREKQLKRLRHEMLDVLASHVGGFGPEAAHSAVNQAGQSGEAARERGLVPEPLGAVQEFGDSGENGPVAHSL